MSDVSYAAKAKFSFAFVFKIHRITGKWNPGSLFMIHLLLSKPVHPLIKISHWLTLHYNRIHFDLSINILGNGLLNADPFLFSLLFPLKPAACHEVFFLSPVQAIPSLALT